MSAKKLQDVKVIRQDRHTIADLRCFLIIEGQPHTVINYSTFGFAIETTTPFKVGSSVLGALHIEDVEICKVNLKVVRVEEGPGGLRAAFETFEDSINTERVTMVSNALRSIGNIHSQNERYTHLPQDFKILIFELKDVLQKIEKKVKDFETQQQVSSASERVAFENAVLDVMSGPIHNSIRDCNLRLNSIMETQAKETVQLGFEFFREQLHDLIYQSPFADRSFKKPLGYAGDFEMMNLIYRNEDFGLSLFGRCMERAMQMHLEPGAVRNRSVYMQQKIHGVIESNFPQKVRILSVASGPAFEVRNVAEELSQDDCQRVDFFLLDQDPISLKSAQRSVLSAAKKQGKDFKLHLLHKPIRQIIAEGLGEQEFDLIYSAGLFDYFSDAVARRAAEIFVQSLSEHGRLIIGNFATSAPNKFGMLTLFDWHLILRSEKDLRRIFDFDDMKLEVESEPNGVNLFCVLQRK